MADNTNIEWCDATWNPIRARNHETGKIGWHCEHVTAGCKFCYADALNANRFGTGLAYLPANRANVEIYIDEKMLAQPVRWKKPRRIFVCSMTDLFGDFVPFGFVMRLLEIMARCPQHTFIILTKRTARMREFFEKWADVDADHDLGFKGAAGPAEVRGAHRSGRGQLFADMLDTMGKPPAGCAYPLFDWAGGMARLPDVLPNVWHGTSAENQATADERIPELLATPSALRWVSAEPLLGPLDLRRYMWPVHASWPAKYNTPDHAVAAGETLKYHRQALIWAHRTMIDWVVAGGESGPGSRPAHPDWFRQLRDHCTRAGTAFFFKQWGGFHVVYDRDRDDPDWRQCDVVARRTPKGQWLNLAGGQGFHGDRVVRVHRATKLSAGRELDGRTRDEYPGSAA